MISLLGGSDFKFREIEDEMVATGRGGGWGLKGELLFNGDRVLVLQDGKGAGGDFLHHSGNVLHASEMNTEQG